MPNYTYNPNTITLYADEVAGLALTRIDNIENESVDLRINHFSAVNGTGIPNIEALKIFITEDDISNLDEFDVGNYILIYNVNELRLVTLGVECDSTDGIAGKDIFACGDKWCAVAYKKEYLSALDEDSLAKIKGFIEHPND